MQQRTYDIYNTREYGEFNNKLFIANANFLNANKFTALSRNAHLIFLEVT